MGNLTLSDTVALSECTLLMPAWMSLRRGSDENSRGSGRPIVICMYLIPAKLELHEAHVPRANITVK